MIRVALAGGIGSGKSAATAYLRGRGYLVVDADEVAREVVRPGRPAFMALVDAFGSALLDPSGALDRAFLAGIVFSDPSARRRVEAITHPRIGEAMAAVLEGAAGDVAFVALPLYRSEHRDLLGLDEVWALEVSPETALARLSAERNMEPADARARIAAQVTNEERRRLADRVIDNEGSLEDLHRSLDDALAGLGAGARRG
ncbi:MAG TPA: dephospho-CoA kinase [Acidimicrobiales bacterium]|nr:MAG: dephospho-CoA kinase [Actinobacteria bacterium 21-73-9]HQU27009.1 dephospho-CoA kinase [Acidimicrobiales bacterium]